MLAVGGLAVLVVSGLVASNGTVGAAERRVLLAVNGLPDGLYRPLAVLQQAGNVLVVIVVVVVLSVVLRSWRLALAGFAVVVAKLVLERVVKLVVERERPATSVGDEVILRGDVPTAGLSFVSGHVILTVALATVLTAHLPPRWRYVPWVFVVLNAFARMYVGAHNPLDVVGGAGLGLLIGALVNLAVAPNRITPTRR